MIIQCPQPENVIPREPEVRRPVRLRLMLPEDKSVLMAILAGTPEFKPGEIVVAEEVIGCFIDQGSASGYRVWVALEGKENVIGYVCFGQAPLTKGTWDIYWIAVAAAWRGRGVGRTLLQHAEAEIGDGGGRMILIETSSKPEYQRTRMFYSRAGYLPVSIISDFYGPGDSKLTLQKLLRL